MPNYIGFSTIQANDPRTTTLNSGTGVAPGSVLKPVSYGNKFMLVDEQLIIRDFLNSLNIPQGQKVGQPQYGTTLWSFIFEPNSSCLLYTSPSPRD